MPSLARLSKRFRAAGTNGHLDLSLTWQVSEDPLNTSFMERSFSTLDVVYLLYIFQMRNRMSMKCFDFS